MPGGVDADASSGGLGDRGGLPGVQGMDGSIVAAECAGLGGADPDGGCEGSHVGGGDGESGWVDCEAGVGISP